MRPIPAPNVTAGEVFALCISRMRNGDLKTRMLSVSRVVAEAADNYAIAATAAELYLLPESRGIMGQVTASEMESVYTQRLVPEKSPGRPIYECLLAAPPHGLCPYCGQRVVSTLDHYLPKAHFSPLVVAPMNLIPLCFECNKIKTDSRPSCAEDQHPHPYVEDYDDARWLAATMIQADPPSLSFHCSPPTSWSTTKSARVQRHFRVLKLGALYASHAAAELVNLRGALRQLHSGTGKEGVHRHLSAIAAGHEQAQPNSWQSAMYIALRDSDWYCDGGFSF